ncbi:ATP-grasp domain-containing protein [Dendronalium sp. ChiSLP03b]|uniref:ATP-grasp domain-containing protein n=1 Tax=Dendronalium sp. ChiSLP03b TaxID=3075381 RepID=UPI002AD23E6E|nr:ATP-grasp domain-containing protein [Dendronalium sp. ChiSLP03b]MDZ8208411.1 ATP-grasp domain-containing protein [Dendronalium sp. ChiSLP03b]
MIVLSESIEQIEQSASANENKLMTEAAQLLGCKVYYIPRDFERCGNAENALWHIPEYAKETAGIWVGYIPELERYEAIYQAALAKGIKLLNTPLEHRIALEFDLFYPHLKGLTPESVIIASTNECIQAGELLGYPVFIKGAVQSRKQQGWESCVANNQEELIRLTEWLLKLKYSSRSKVIVRKLVKLRHQRLAPNGFPMGREFRCFIYNQQILKYGYYWDGQDNLSQLSKHEEKQVLSLAILAAERLRVPYIAIDIGQLESGEWIVIETADAQFAGVCQIPALELWNKLKDISSYS